MNRIWINYNLWEDHKAGLYSKNKQDEKIKTNVIEMFKHENLFLLYALDCLFDWKNSMNHNLSFSRSNRRSYIGQATACHKFGANIITTCKAWECLTKEEQTHANSLADIVIDVYEKLIYKEPNSEKLDEELS